MAYQHHNIPPAIFMGLRTCNEPITEGERAFMIASDEIAVEHNDRTLRLRDFVRGEENERWQHDI